MSKKRIDHRPNAADTQRPNVLLITVHDLGTRLGCYGYDSIVSPHLDALAADGVRFEKNFCTAPYCSPSRGGIITGKYPHVNGLMGLVNLGWNWDPANTTLAKALGRNGYETFLLGYQHEARNDRLEDLGFQDVSDMSKDHHCATVAPRVAGFLRERAAQTTPFYARVGFFEVHRPFESYAPENPERVTLPGWLKDTPGAREDLAQYDGCIRDMDAACGVILTALEEAGLADDTLVIFTTDHGSPYPGGKATLYDAGTNTTLLMRWPRGFAGEQSYDELLSNVDLFPTILEAAGVDVPGDIQGRSFLPLLQGRAYHARTEVFAELTTRDSKRAIRTERYKYIRNYSPGPALLLADSEAGLVRRDFGNEHMRPRPEFELYDLAEDPFERVNLAGRPDSRDIERDLAQRLRAIQEETCDPVLNGPISRPAEELEIQDRSLARLLAKCSYSREGLRCAQEESSRDDWQFATLPETAPGKAAE
jgi:arylsulfatase A-like enzyme